MWKCKQCHYKNNNSSDRCHGNNCKAERKYESILGIHEQRTEKLRHDRKVLDGCPKCKKETVFEFLRLKNGKKTYKCTECNAVCYQTGKSKPVPEEIVT